MSNIPAHILDQLNQQADLVGMIGRYTTLKRSGQDFKGCCPFHGEKTPSFFVNPRKNVYHCFGCKVSGNAITFLMEYERLTFREAAETLSHQTGIALPVEEKKSVAYRKLASSANPSYSNSNQSQMGTPQVVQKPPVQVVAPIGIDPAQNLHHSQNPQNPQDSPSQVVAPVGIAAGQEVAGEGNLYELLDRVCQFYQGALQQSPVARDYFLSRGVSEQSLQTFALGYAPSAWQSLVQAFSADIEGLMALGLVRVSEKGRHYDLLRDRVIFPIRDGRGQVIAFAGRALDDSVPKYINSPDSVVFHKGQVLYGYYESRKMKAAGWLVVEGYMDVIALYQAGIFGAVAPMGTAMNAQQMGRLLNLDPVLTLCFDGDSAGQKAAWRTLEVGLPILSDDKTLRFLTLPDKHDPDSFIKAHGKAAMQDQIAQAVPLSAYIFVTLSRQYDLNLTEGKAGLMAAVRKLTSQLPKGSSFRYLLNNDIYQKLGGNRRRSQGFGQSAKAEEILLNFQSDLTVPLVLSLCLIYQPDLLKTDPILQIWQDSGILALSLPSTSDHFVRQDPPPLPSWRQIDANLANLVIVLERLLPSLSHLPEVSNIKSHFILGALPEAIRQEVLPYWQDFYQGMQDRQIVDLSILLSELLRQSLISVLTQQIKQGTSIWEKTLIRKRAQHLRDWEPDWR